MDQNSKENLLISLKFSNPASFALFSTFLVPQSKLRQFDRHRKNRKWWAFRATQI